MTDVSRFVDKAVKAPTGSRLSIGDALNFVITNRIPRLALTRAMGRLSRIEHPWVTRVGLWIWTRFTPIDLSEAEGAPYPSLHAVFTRRLRPGARPIDPDPAHWCSPCDALVGAHGSIENGLVLQAKGMPYAVQELVGPTVDLAPFVGGRYLTLRLTSAMYHRFHAPDHLTLDHVTFLRGDVWNVNPPALARVNRLFCRNERAVLHTRVGPDALPVLMVPVAAVLVASLRLRALSERLHLRYGGPTEIPVGARYRRGEELGSFEHGSTIILLLPPGVTWVPTLQAGQTVRMGQALLRRCDPQSPSGRPSAPPGP